MSSVLILDWCTIAPISTCAHTHTHTQDTLMRALYFARRKKQQRCNTNVQFTLKQNRTKLQTKKKGSSLEMRIASKMNEKQKIRTKSYPSKPVNLCTLFSSIANGKTIFHLWVLHLHEHCTDDILDIKCFSTSQMCELYNCALCVLAGQIFSFLLVLWKWCAPHMDAVLKSLLNHTQHKTRTE